MNPNNTSDDSAPVKGEKKKSTSIKYFLIAGTKKSWQESF